MAPAALLLVALALGVDGRLWQRYADSSRYDRKFLFHGYPAIVCGGYAAISSSPWSGPSEVRVRLPSVHEEYCKVSLTRGWTRHIPVGRLLRLLALKHGLPAPIKYDGDDGGLVYRMDWPSFDCIERTNISESVFDFIIVEAGIGGARSRCNFVLPLFGQLPELQESVEEETESQEDQSAEASRERASLQAATPRPHNGALVLGLHGLPDVVCRPLDEPVSQQDDADFFEPAFYARRLADVPLVCQFRLDWDAWLRGVSTHALLKELARHVDVTISDYDPSGWSAPEVSFPYVRCAVTEQVEVDRYVFTVTGPSGRTATCWFVPNVAANGTCYREQLDANCPPGFRFLTDGRCCTAGT